MEMVPMALINKISENELIFHFISQGAYVIEKVITYDYMTKLCILQFYISHALKIAFSSRININECCLVPEIVYQTFGSLEAENIVKCLERIEEKKDIICISKEKIEADDMGYKLQS